MLHTATQEKIPPIPPVILPTSNAPGETKMYEPQPHIKWLDLIFDSKLSFRQYIQHLASRGAAAAGCLRMLMSTKNRQSHRNIKTLTCYANGIGNPTTPDTAELHETASSGATGFKNRPDKSYPQTTTNPAMKEEQQTYHRDPSPPHGTGKKETRHAQQVERIDGARNHKRNTKKHRKKLPSHTIPPWRNDAKEKRYATRLTTNPTRRGTTKGEAANKHRTRISQYHKELNILLHIPTDQ